MVGNFERFDLNWLAEFRNKEVESEYREYEKTTSLKTVVGLQLLFGFIFSMFSIYDYIIIGIGDSFFISLCLRILSLLLCGTVYFLASKIGSYSRSLLMVTITQLLIYTFYLVIMYIQEGRDPSIMLISVMLFIMVVFLVPNSWKNSLIASLLIFVGYIIFWNNFSPHTALSPIVRQGIFLGIGLIFCAISIYGRERSQRRHYAAEKIMEHMIITDKLTGIYNRGRFEYILELWIKNLRHYPFCLILFDIDNFKKVNDHFGHSVGDQVLIATTEVVRQHIRDTDVFARWGGEEFVVLFSAVNIDIGMALAERIRAAVEATAFEKTGKVTISIGVAEYRKGETVLDLVERADGKMYEAKRAGRNKVIGDYEMSPNSGDQE